MYVVRGSCSSGAVVLTPPPPHLLSPDLNTKVIILHSSHPALLQPQRLQRHNNNTVWGDTNMLQLRLYLPAITC